MNLSASIQLCVTVHVQLIPRMYTQSSTPKSVLCHQILVSLIGFDVQTALTALSAWTEKKFTH